jgi:hypothetical protein
LIPEKRLTMGKRVTEAIERNHTPIGISTHVSSANLYRFTQYRDGAFNTGTVRKVPCKWEQLHVSSITNSLIATHKNAEVVLSVTWKARL